MDRFLKKLPKQYHHKVQLIPNAVDAATEPKADWSNNGVLRILFVGRIEAYVQGLRQTAQDIARVEAARSCAARPLWVFPQLGAAMVDGGRQGRRP